MSTAWRYASTSTVPLGANFNRFRLARLQAESSRNMYSLHGLLALMRAVFFDVCQRLTVVSYCMPGSPQRQVASESLYISSLAFTVCLGRPSLPPHFGLSTARTPS